MKSWSVLTRGLPSSVTVNGVRVPLETDYRVGLLVSALAEDTALPDGVRMDLLLRLYCKAVPERVDREALALALLDFYAVDPDRQRVPQRIPQQKTAGRTGEPILDFDADGDRIVAAFWQAYGIDLPGCRMHWWLFMALLLSLPEDTAFMQTVRLRTMDLREVQDDGLRKKLRQAKGAVRLRKKDIEKGEKSIWQTEA
ncbi:MAG: hypothetical protein IJ480_00400 [Clostridia bacterium]|nr:hypothetical protein [Clostridia bacterium]